VKAVIDDSSFMHGFIYAGNAMACATLKTALEVMLEERLMQWTTDLGTKLRDVLMELQRQFEFIGHIRGMRLLLAFELIVNLAAREVLTFEWNSQSKIVKSAYEKN
jgi:adenosylmethionine-8-amino-7-oxononanoate aminotransferase